MDRWYISDHHLAHYNILEYGKRPFANLQEMHEALLTYHNEIVKPNDHCSFLGDVTLWRGGVYQKQRFTEEIKKYNGHLRLYLGNHDHWNADFYRLAGFEKVYATWRCEEGFISSHFPLHPRSLSTATANVHGHIHQNPDYEPVIFEEWKRENGSVIPRKVVPYINVSVEAVNYRPVHMDAILARIKEANGS
jgi:calcineurin-like phosphoesterase family protein